MASVHVREIQEFLRGRGEEDAVRDGSGGFFLEIRFDDAARRGGNRDPEFQNKVMTVDSPQGTVTITFDDEGLLRSLDIS